MGKDTILVDIEGYGKIEVERGISILSVIQKLGIKKEDNNLIVGALYNNRIIGLEYLIKRSCRIKFLTLETENGMEIYRRSLVLLLHAAFKKKINSFYKLKIEHSLNKGYYFSIEKIESNSAERGSIKDKEKIKKSGIEEISEEISKEDVNGIVSEMKRLVNEKRPFIKQEMEVEDALDIFENHGLWDRYWLLRYQDHPRASLYTLEGCTILAQGPLVPHTGYLKIFSVTKKNHGLILNFPLPETPLELPKSIKQEKLFQIFSEHREWTRILDVDSVGKLNKLIIEGGIDNLIWVSEGLHEKKIAQIADIISRNVRSKRIILMAGPSSSGKTTFAKRLTIQLLANGIKPEVISLDNYYLPREQIPKDENGKLDFESLYALDLELIQKHLKMLLEGKPVTVPKYDFKTGQRKKEGISIKIDKNQIVIIEGIHGMNEKLTSNISKDEKFKIYISALTQLNLDYVNRIPTSTVRLIRRIVRDNQFRAYTAKQTITQWPSVRAGEEKHIFPFQEEADIMFNSSLVYELAVLRGFLEPLLKQIEDSEEIYTEAKKLLHFISNFVYISPDHVPLTSILREFIGGSGFRY